MASCYKSELLNQNGSVMISREHTPASDKIYTKFHGYRKHRSFRFSSLRFGRSEEDNEDDDEIPLLSIEEDRCRHRGLSRDDDRLSYSQFSHDDSKISANVRRRSLTEYLEYEVQNGDTLQSVSIRHGCSATDLKQANNWFSDQDFYAQKTIRIPTKPHSILSEYLQGSHSASSSKTLVNTDENGGINKRTVSVGIGRILNAEKTTASDDFLCKMDLDLACIREKTKLYKDSLDEVVASLNSPQIGPLVVVPKTSSCNGADCGISWWSLILIIFIIGLVLPLCYTVYLKTIAAGKDSKILSVINNQTHYHQS